jgi:hypothetical protein
MSRSRVIRLGTLVGLLIFAFVACGRGDLIVGDDSLRVQSDAAGSDEAAPAADASGRDGESAPDAHVDTDGGAAPCKIATSGVGQCLPTGTACSQASTNTCPGAGQFCCAVPCPELVQPQPGICDGGGFAPRFDSTACTIGFACTPMTCVEGGGVCVSLSPGSCKSNRIGPANEYSCGSGLGVMCCLP